MYFFHLRTMALVVCHLVVTLFTASARDSLADGACKTYADFISANLNGKWYCYNENKHLCEPAKENPAPSGRPNCFPTEELCYWHCRAHTDCLLPRDHGYSECGQESKLMYYFDNQTQRCTLFLRKGCGGNGNVFDTLHHCEVTCRGLTCITVISPEPEYCVQPQGLEFFYYSAHSGSCMKHNRCNRLGSNYNSFKDCQEACIYKTAEDAQTTAET